MPTAMTHALVGLGLGKCFTGRKLPFLFWGLAAGLAALPDLDVLAFKLGIPYESPFGHRGFSHSFLFALLLSVPLAFLTYRKLRAPYLDLVGFFFVVIASHGILDAFTNGGEGIAFFWPVDNARYFFPWRPIQVSDIGMSFFSGGRGGLTLWTEFVWICVPMAVVVAVVMGGRALVSRVAPMPDEVSAEEIP